jgi:hypothetical protein
MSSVDMREAEPGSDACDDCYSSDYGFEYDDGADSEAGSRDAPAALEQARASSSKKCAYRIIDATALKRVQVRAPGGARAGAAGRGASAHIRGTPRRSALWGRPPPIHRPGTPLSPPPRPQDEAVDVVVSILSCRPSVARSLLRFYRWDSEKIMSGSPVPAPGARAAPWAPAARPWSCGAVRGPPVLCVHACMPLQPPIARSSP